MKLIQKLDLLMKEKGINRAELSRGSGIPYTTIINFYKKGTDNVKLSTLRKLSNYFNCSLDYLVDDNITENKTFIESEYNKNDVFKMDYNNITVLPIVGVVRAGEPISAVENIEGYFPIDKSFLCTDKEYFFLKVKGDSMNLEFKEGSLLLIEKTPCIKNGDIGVVLVNGYEATVKKVIKNDNMITLIPMSNNPKYIPKMIDLSKQEVYVIGKVIMAIKQY